MLWHSGGNTTVFRRKEDQIMKSTRLFLVLTVVLAVGVFVASDAMAESFMWGDLGSAPGPANPIPCNGHVGGQDAVLVLRWYAGLIDQLESCPSGTLYTSPDFPPGGDLNGDGKLGGQDAAQILKFYAGLITCFPVDTNCDGMGPDNGAAFTLAITVVGSGTVGRNPDGGTYSAGTAVTLKPVPSANWRFDHWEGALSGSTNPGEVTMDANKTVTAVFVEVTPTTYTLTANVTGQGTVAMDPTGGVYSAGTVVTLTPIPSNGWRFDHWEGTLSGSAVPTTLTVTANATVTAAFVLVPPPTYTLTANVTGQGTVAMDPTGGVYPVGTVVTLTPTPANGWRFDHWEGAISGSTVPTTLTITANATVTAVFVLVPPPTYTLTTNVTGQGTVAMDPVGGVYPVGTAVTLTPHPNVGWRFDHWEGAASGSTVPFVLTVTANATVTAVFVEVSPGLGSLSVTIVPSSAVADGAQWKLDDGPWLHAVGYTLPNVSVGSHRVFFSVIAAWIKPVSQAVDIVAGQTATVTGTYEAQLASNSMVVFGYNDLGMHCMNQDFSEMMILPPYNTLHAQVIDRGGEDPRIVTSGVEISYRFPSNTTSFTKTNFWDYAQALFGLPSPLQQDMGLAGNGLTGTMNSLVADGRTDWSAVGIPLTPLDDDLTENAYALAVITVSRAGQDLVQTQAVAPVSWEISCNICHKTSGISPATDILRAHDTLHGTSLESSKPVTCGVCHGQPALGMAGNTSLPTLSRAMHGAHAPRMAQAQLQVECYACHPGKRTQCFRDLHFSHGMICNDCHGDMTSVADPSRLPWQTEPRCETCHQSRQPTFEFEQPGTLYRNSKGHHGIHCEACHGSPHAITPTVKIEDNIQAIAIQGHEGKIDTCTVCHSQQPEETFPHVFQGGGDGK